MADVAAQEETIRVLAGTVSSGAANLPHLLFYGPPGTGKTSTILALARQLYGAQVYRSRVLELNASDERGIQVVREKVKNFARIQVSSADPATVPFKLIILDEADSLTRDAQSALRRTMETYSNVTRFCLICNYISRIIEPLTSRCAKFRFRSLPRPHIELCLLRIIQSEHLDLGSSDNVTRVVASLFDVSGGDLRKAITYLQTASYLSGPLDEERLQDMAGLVPISILDQLVEVCRVGSVHHLARLVRDMIADGYSANQILYQLQQRLLDGALMLTSSLKVGRFQLFLAEAEKKLLDGADEHLQLLAIAVALRSMFQN